MCFIDCIMYDSDYFRATVFVKTRSKLEWFPKRIRFVRGNNNRRVDILVLLLLNACAASFIEGQNRVLPERKLYASFGGEENFSVRNFVFV